MPADSTDSLIAKSASEDDGVYGALTLIQAAKLQSITRQELEEMVMAWRAVHDLPSEIINRDQIIHHVGPQLSYLDLSNNDLSEMDLRFVKLVHCNLSRANLNSIQLDGAYFFGCDLSHIDSWVASFRCTTFQQCYIVNSRFMYGHFEGASFAHCNLESTKLIGSYQDGDTSFFQAYLRRTDLQHAHLEKVNLKEVRTLYGARLYLAHLEETEIDYSLFGGKIGEELEREFAQAARTYAAIKANLEAAGDYGQAAQAYVKERQMEKSASAPWNARKSYGVSELGDKYSQEHDKLTRANTGAKWRHPRTWKFYLRHTVKWATDWIVELLCSYGESGWRVLFWIGASLLVIGPALIQSFGGLDWTGDNIHAYYNLTDPFQRQLYTYFQYVLYMIDAFTTASFAQLKPVNDLVRLASGFMAFLGIFLAGLLGFVAGNRIRHS